MRDKGHVTVQPESDDGGVIDMGTMPLQANGANATKSFQLSIHNAGNKDFLFGYQVLEYANGCYANTITYDVSLEMVNKHLRHKQRTMVPITVRANDLGDFHVPLVFWFQAPKEKPFYIVKFIKFQVVNGGTSGIPQASRDRSDQVAHGPSGIPPVSGDNWQKDGVDIMELRKKLVTNR